MLVTTEWIYENFHKFNSMFWGGCLPTPQFKISVSKKIWGRASYTIDRKNNCLKNYKITLSNYYDSPEWVKQNTLIHEMIHLADYVFHPDHFIGRRNYNSHGHEFFIPETERIKAFGWNIEKSATDFEVESSHLSDTARKRLDRKMEKQYVMYIGACMRKISKKTGKAYDFTVVKPVGGIPTKKSYEICKKLGLTEIILVKTNAERYVTMRGSSYGGRYATAADIDEVMAVSEVICTADQLADMMKKKSR